MRFFLSCMITVYHTMKRCWAYAMIIDHSYDTLLIICYDHWSLPWKTVDHTLWSLIIAMKRLLIIHDVLHYHVTMKVIVTTNTRKVRASPWTATLLSSSWYICFPWPSGPDHMRHPTVIIDVYLFKLQWQNNCRKDHYCHRCRHSNHFSLILTLQ